MKNKIRTIIVLLFAASLIYLTACNKEEKVEHIEKAIPVKTAPVKFEKISIPVHSSGKIVSDTETKLSFKTPGIIEKIFVDAGQNVKAGQTLAKLNLAEINSKVLQAKEGFEKAERDLKRVENLYKDSVVTLEQLQNARTGKEIAQSNLEIAKFNQKHSTIYAPGDGKILNRLAEEGELINAGMPVFVFGSTVKGWKIKTGVTDKDVVKLRKGDPAEISIDAYPGEKFSAIVNEIGNAANPYTGTFEVELKLNKSVNGLASGFVAKINIYPSEVIELNTIPVEALFEANGNNAIVYTYIPQTMRAEKKEIQIADILKDKVAVSLGLENVTSVITDGVEYLANGKKIKLISEEENTGRKE